MANRDILAIGTSAGGFEALRFLAKELPSDLPAAILVVIHLPSQFRSDLDAILTQSGPLAASFAQEGEVFQRRHIYIAPPERHLLVDGDRLQLGKGPRENNARPAIDPLFRSAALCCGPRAVGVVLTGTLSDGASGLQALKHSGGITVVQDPTNAAYAEMPATALSRSKPDHVVGLVGMLALLERLALQPAGKAMPVPEAVKYEVEVARSGHSSMRSMDRIGRRSVLACPDCHGVMWEIDEGDLIRYRCHVGHAYTAELMSLALDENLRRALASALRALDERTALAQKLYRDAHDSGRERAAQSWVTKVQEFEEQASVIRDSMMRLDEIDTRSTLEFEHQRKAQEPDRRSSPGPQKARAGH
ncbi:MAG: chemotaxis protein CheB [Methylobacteriaceae bacterium]|nr:chemotaxis protein CheB [Methylobacteriaceae bacterium]